MLRDLWGCFVLVCLAAFVLMTALFFGIILLPVLAVAVLAVAVLAA